MTGAVANHRQRRRPLYAALFDINFQQLTSQYFPDSLKSIVKGTLFRKKGSQSHRSKGCSYDSGVTEADLSVSMRPTAPAAPLNHPRCDHGGLRYRRLSMGDTT